MKLLSCQNSYLIYLFQKMGYPFLMISIEVTTKCNLKCKNCFAHENTEKLAHINLDTAIEIAKEGKELGYTQLSITGGEPLLWPHLYDFLELAVNMGYTYIFLNTNGHLITKEVCSKLAKYNGIIEYSCTINGYKDEHDSVRGAGSYKLATEGLKIGLEFGLSVTVYCVVSKSNLNSLPKFTSDLYNSYPGIKAVVFIQLRGIESEYYNVSDLKLEPEDLIALVKIAGFLTLGGYNSFILENSLTTVVAKELGLKWLTPSPEISRAGKIVVLQNLNITLNHSCNINLGSYTKGVLESILSSSLYIENTESESPLCSGCRFLCKCRESGKLRPSDEYHNVGSNDKFYCQKVLELICD